jgi:hypothetical protein
MSAERGPIYALPVVFALPVLAALSWILTHWLLGPHGSVIATFTALVALVLALVVAVTRQRAP